MPYQVNCVKCGKALTLPDQALGRVIQCRHCQQSFLVPHPSGAMPVAPSPPPVIVAAPPMPRAVAQTPGPMPNAGGRPQDFVQSFDAPELLEDEEGAPAGRGTPPVGNRMPEDRKTSSRRRSPSRGSPGRGTPGVGSRGRGNTRAVEREGRGDERGGRGGKAVAKSNGTGVAMIVGAAVVAIGLIAFFAMQGKEGGKDGKGKDGKGAKVEKPAPPPPPPPTKEELAWKAAQGGNHAEAAKLFDEASEELDKQGKSQRAVELSRESNRQRAMADEKGQK